MSDPGLLTVVVLTYNRKAFLAESLQALRRQTFVDFSAYILDNASDDGTEFVVQPFLTDPRFRYLRHEKNIGAVGNHNYSFGIGETPYLCITHDDDVMEPRFLETLVRVLENDRSIDLAFCNTDAIDNTGRVIKSGYFSSLFGLTRNIRCEKLDFIKKYIRSKFNIVCPATVLRREPILTSGFRFQEKAGPGADTHFWMQLNFLDGAFHYEHEVLYRYRLHPGQDSSLSAAILSTKLYRPGLFLLLQQGAFNEASAWRNRFVWDNFIAWSKAAYEHRSDAVWNRELDKVRHLDLGWLLNGLLWLIPTSPTSRVWYYRLLIVNLFRLHKLRGLFP